MQELTFIGHSKPIVRIREIIQEIADHPVNVLIEGETGTGKSLLARVIHDCSSRREQSFVDIHCGLIPENLFESELFGHEKGAFTGAYKQYTGKLQLANGGTLFLDEIGTIGHNMQVKLLKVMEEKTFFAVGSNKEVQVDIRIISATNENLPQLVQQHKFREDLYYRLNVVTITIPPLRERKSDIPLLADHFLTILAQKYQQKKALSSAAKDKLLRYAWPGNNRALFNLLENVFLFTKSPIIRSKDITLDELQSVESTNAPSEQKRGVFLEPWLESHFDQKNNIFEEFEREALRIAWKRFHGNKSDIARYLQISRGKLYRLLERYPCKDE